MPEHQRPIHPPVRLAPSPCRATVFVAHPTGGVMPAQAGPLLRALERLGAVTLVLCGDALMQQEWRAAFPGLTCRSAPGDTPLPEGYRIGLQQLGTDPDRLVPDQLILCDDRSFGPVGSVVPLLGAAQASGAGVWGAFARGDGSPLPDDGWLILNRPAWLDPLTQAWLRGDAVPADGTLAGLLERTGLGVSGRAAAEDGLHHPLADLEAGFPLLRAEALRSSRHTGDSIAQTLSLLHARAPEIHAAALAEMEIARFGAAPEVGFSLIVPVLAGQEAALERTLGTAFAQTHPRFEVIAVATAGAETAQWERRFAAECTRGRLRLIAGTEAADGWQARNVALALARYDWIVCPEPGEELPPAWLGRLAEAIVEHPGHDSFLTCGPQMPSSGTARTGGDDVLGAFVHRRALMHRAGGFDPDAGALAGAELIARLGRVQPPLQLALTRPRAPAAAPRPTQPEAVIVHRADATMPTVSTVIVSYNHQDFIAEAIESALAQRTPFPHEILISDDGSSDGTGRIVARYAARYPDRIRNIGRSGNHGISENYRHCLREARGRFVAILEGDDYWNDPDKIAKQAGVMMREPDVGLVFSRYVSLDMTDGKLRRLKSQETLPPFLTGADFAALPSLNYIVNLSCIMVRRAAMICAPACLYDPRLSEIALAFYMDRLGRIGFLNEIMTVYRLNQGSVWFGADPPERLRQAIAVRKAAIAVARPEYRMQILERLREKEAELAELTH
ncbi:glycosyltransferase family 2 protein [Paenirhodobacter enshiensis]|uniref:glycosyltransferase family 2 protein n=1 Tax=Paenirhodobacter enshiensis TaxID=1105367 RepID=UPI0013782DC9|nr:glycosyltransferase family 2 protein [Paenirhodobacter enshiensis]